MEPSPTAPPASVTQCCRDIARALNTVIRGQAQVIRHLLAAFVSGGHVLLDDFPGTGKTTLSKALAGAIDADFRRVQFTPDLLPSDLIGVSIFNQRDQVFEFHRGPVFTHILLADEINRSSPRTQSALLEAMAERQVTVDGERHPLGGLFFVIATQNPIEFHGTYPLPEAQMDRFFLRLRLGYVDAATEVAILDDAAGPPAPPRSPCASLDDVRRIAAAAGQVRISDEIKRYIVDIVAGTRTAEGVRMGASPRASLALMGLARALALFDETGFVTPEHVQEIAVQAIAHRLVMDPQARFAGRTPEETVRQVMESIDVPV